MAFDPDVLSYTGRTRSERHPMAGSAHAIKLDPRIAGIETLERQTEFT